MPKIIRHFVRITLFIVSRPPRSSTEHVFSYGDKMKTATAKVGGINAKVYVRAPTLSTCRLQVSNSFFDLLAS